MGVWVSGHDATKFSNISKAVEFHLPIFLTRLDAEKIMVEKLPKKWILRGLKLRGLMYFIYENDQRKKFKTLGDFDNITPTHMYATHGISKSQQNFQNRFPRELDQKFGIPRIGTIH